MLMNLFLRSQLIQQKIFFRREKFLSAMPVVLARVNYVNPWESKACKTGIAFESGPEQNMLIQHSVKKEGTHVSLENNEAIAYLTLTDPWYKNLTPPVFHISKETIRPYYHGWVFRKGSVWREKIDQHILLMLQVFFPFISHLFFQ